jgi:hypothetical protein
VLRSYETPDAADLEREIHEELKSSRWQFEWFHPGSDVDLVIERLDRQFMH